MLKVKDIAYIIQQKAPLSLALEFDSAGLNVGDENAEVRGILVAQNVTYATLEECRQKGLNLLITHHPCVFGEEPDRYMLSLAKRAEEYGINLYSCHTNLDCCDGGLNDFVAKLIRMRDIKNIDGCARCGEVDEIFLKDFAEAVSQRLNDSCVKYVGSDKRMIKKVALCTGAGARDEELVLWASDNGVDCIVGGESKLSIALTARDLGVALVDVGHYTSEILCTDIFADWLKEYAQLLHISQSDVDPYKSIKSI